MQNWFSYDGVSTGASRLSTDHTHVFVDLVKGRDSLDDVVVLLVHAELDLSAGVCVTETKNGAVDVAGLELLDKLARVLAKTTEEVRDDLGGLGGFAGKVREGSLDASCQVAFAQTKGDGLLLASLGEVGLEGRAQKVGKDTLRNVVDFLERILGSLERCKANKLDGLSKLVKILDSLLDFGKAVANGVGLQNYFEDLRRALASLFDQKALNCRTYRIADRALVEEIVNRHRDCRKA
jgi:hypothetical protein